MSHELIQNDTANRWRDKYLNLIDKHDQLEKGSALRQGQMRRALVMVSLLAEGQADSLDRPLVALRDVLKAQKNTQGFESSLDRLQKEVTRFEDKRGAEADQLSELLSKALAQLLELPLSSDTKKYIKRIRRDSKRQLAQWSGYAVQLKSWAKIIDKVSMEGKLEVAPEGGGFWQKVFQKTLPDEPKSDQTVAEQGQENAPENDHAGLEVEQGVSVALERMLAKLVIPDSYQQRLQALEKRLLERDDGTEIMPLLEDIMALVVEALGNGQQRFEQFLQGLDQGLVTIQTLIDDANQGQLNRCQAREEFESILHGQVAEIRSVVDSKHDLGDLGRSITDHLGLILHTMSEYRSEENERETILAQQLEVMQHKLNEMEGLAEHAQQTIEAQHHKAMHDSLTGLANRDAYESRLQQEQQRLARYGGQLSMVVCDVDLFKRINDGYGHLAGDKVLKILASTLQYHVRETDFIARFGGEEFVVLMPETSLAGAELVADKLRQQVEACPFHFKKALVKITMSFGVAEFSRGELSDEVFERADRALYHAKEEGRNRVRSG